MCEREKERDRERKSEKVCVKEREREGVRGIEKVFFLFNRFWLTRCGCKEESLLILSKL